VVDNLTIAREVEVAVKGDLVRDEYDIADHKVVEVVTLDSFFEKHFLPWAKEHKRMWRNDRYLYDSHLKPRFGNKPLDQITGFDVDKMKLAMKKAENKQGRPLHPCRHQTCYRIAQETIQPGYPLADSQRGEPLRRCRTSEAR